MELQILSYQLHRQDAFGGGDAPATEMLWRAPGGGPGAAVPPDGYEVQNFKRFKVLENESIFQNFNISWPKKQFYYKKFKFLIIMEPPYKSREISYEFYYIL